MPLPPLLDEGLGIKPPMVFWAELKPLIDIPPLNAEARSGTRNSNITKIPEVIATLEAVVISKSVTPFTAVSSMPISTEQITEVIIKTKAGLII